MQFRSPPPHPNPIRPGLKLRQEFQRQAEETPTFRNASKGFVPAPGTAVCPPAATEMNLNSDLLSSACRNALPVRHRSPFKGRDLTCMHCTCQDHMVFADRFIVASSGSVL